MHQYYSLGSNGMDRVCSLQKIPMRLHGTTCALIGPVQPILHRVPCSNETLPNEPKHYKMLQNMSLVPMGWIECVLCQKFWCDFMAQTCALIAPVQPILHRVSCSNETLTNAPKTTKCTETWVNAVDRVRSLRKIPIWLHDTNLCINCTSSTQLSPNSV